MNLDPSDPRNALLFTVVTGKKETPPGGDGCGQLAGCAVLVLAVIGLVAVLTR